MTIEPGAALKFRKLKGNILRRPSRERIMSYLKVFEKTSAPLGASSADGLSLTPKDRREAFGPYPAELMVCLIGQIA